MANHNSALKAARQNIKRKLINQSRMSRIKTYCKRVLAAAQTGSIDHAKSALIQAQSEIMKGVTKGILKLNTASRKVKFLANKVKRMGDNQFS